MTKVLTVGVFDYFHLGHLRLFQQAKTLGDFLTVAVQDGDYILKFKPNATICYTTEQRIEMIQALKLVDNVCVYQSIADFIPHADFDIFAIGEDQTHEGFQQAVQWCQENNKQVIRMKRTPKISSSQIKKALL